jgi:2-polyprenyl-3-methyl-5-hydroxy-6-metoxy-1,4-benzoquinol methylase
MSLVAFKDIDTIDPGTKERYHFASFYCKNKVVLDIACNGGYGSGILSEVAEKVAGYDISSECIDFANRYWKTDKTVFQTGDVLELSGAHDYDVVVSLETIEHLKSGFSESVSALAGHLKKGGILIVSFPEDEHAEPNDTHRHTRIKTEDVAKAFTDNNLSIINVVKQGCVDILKSEYRQAVLIGRL